MRRDDGCYSGDSVTLNGSSGISGSGLCRAMQVLVSREGPKATPHHLPDGQCDKWILGRIGK